MRRKIQILLLGPPAVLHEGVPRAVTEKRARALLFYLASQGGSTPDAQLISLLNEENITGQTQFNLDILKSTLCAQVDETSLLVEKNGATGLNFRIADVDQVRFQQAVDRAGHTPWRTPAQQPLPDESLYWLRKAAQSWQTPEFMSGEDFPAAPLLMTWFQRRKAHLESLLARVQSRLAEHEYATGNWSACLALAKAALLHDEFNEKIHRLVLQTLLQLDRVSEAHDYFDQVSERIRKKLDTTPGPKLMELYRQLGAHAGREAQRLAHPNWPGHSPGAVPFVNRPSELGVLQEAWEKGGALMILGSAGQGKTRLLQEFTAQIQKPYRLLGTACQPAENSLTFQPIIELLRNYIEAEELLALPDDQAARLSRLLPEILDLRPELHRLVHEERLETGLEASRASLMEAVRQVFLQAAEDGPVLFCLEDAHWADETTLALCSYLLTRPPFDDRSLFILTARPEGKTSEFNHLLDAIRQMDRGQVFNLPELSRQEVGELSRYLLGYPLSEETSEQLTLKTGGNPLFLIEVLQAYQAQNPERPLNSSAGLPIPATLHTWIESHLGRLEPAMRKYLEIAALIGPLFKPESVAGVGGFSPSEANALLLVLIAKRLLEPLSRCPEDPYHRFRHSIFREVLLQEVHPLRACLLHRAIVRELEGCSGSKKIDRAGELAWHYEQAGELVHAFEYRVQAAQRARQLYSSKDAKSHFNRAEKLIAQTSELDERQITVFYARWCELAFVLEDIATLEHISQSLLQLGKIRNSSLLTGSGLNVRSDIYMVQNRFQAALETVQQALPYMERSGFVYKQMETYIRLGTYCYMINRADAAIEAFQDALAVGSGHQDELVTRARGNAHYHLAFSNILKGRPELALQHALHSLDDFRAVANLHGQVTAHSAIALAHYYMGEFETSRQAARIGLELARQIGARRMIGYLTAYRGMAAMLQGRLEPAMNDFTEVINLGLDTHHGETAGAGYRLTGDAHLLLHDTSQAVVFYRQGLEATQGGFMFLDCQIRLGMTLYRTGHKDEGRKLLLQALTASQEAGLDLMSLQARLGLATVDAQEGRFEEAGSQAWLLDEELRRRKLEILRAMNMVLLARVALQQGRTNQAIYLLQKANRLNGVRNNPWSRLTIQTLLVQALQTNGQPHEIHRLVADTILSEIESVCHPDLHEQMERFRKRIHRYMLSPEEVLPLPA